MRESSPDQPDRQRFLQPRCTPKSPAVSQRTVSKRRRRKPQSNNRAAAHRTGTGRLAVARPPCGAACRAQAATHRAQPPSKGHHLILKKKKTRAIIHGREPPASTASPFSGRQLPCRAVPASLLFWGRSFFLFSRRRHMEKPSEDR